MKIKIEVPQIFAKEITHPKTDDDEIYLCYFVTLAKAGDENNKVEVKKYVSKKISTVEDHVWAGDHWAPKDLDAEIDTGDAKVLYVNMALYERDDGAIYKKLKASSEAPIEPEDFDWSCVTLPSDFTSPMEWIKAVWKLVCGVFSYFRQDDLIGEQSFACGLTAEMAKVWSGTRELKFKRYGGDYRVTVKLTVS